ncbi:patatin-like phospholipase domain-containing protein 2 isoform X2 [Antennarius striatus]
MAREARKHALGVFHPTFSLLRAVRDSLLGRLPADAHLRASGKLCVSLTRLADGENVLVSQFDSREELIQVLMCSCFFPVYCGFVPPSYRGVRYMDGALSNNMPLFEQRNTITVAPFSGESDICPREGTFNFFEAHYGNVSIQVNTGNVHRICTSFLPPRLETLAEICHNGYLDALRFLGERDLRPAGPAVKMDRIVLCCEPAAEEEERRKTMVNGPALHRGEHHWLDLKLVENLPISFKRVLCEACRDSRDGADLLPVRVLVDLLTFVLLPVELTAVLVRSVVLSGCTAIGRLLMTTAGRRGAEEGRTPTGLH